MNNKTKGEIGESIVIGELAKNGVLTAIPLADNLRFDLVIIYNNELYKAQIKTAKPKDGYVVFDMTSSYYYKTTKRSLKYDKNDIDVMLLCDYNNVFILSEDEFHQKKGFTIRYQDKKTIKTQHLFKDYVLSPERLKKILSK